MFGFNRLKAQVLCARSNLLYSLGGMPHTQLDKISAQLFLRNTTTRYHSTSKTLESSPTLADEQKSTQDKKEFEVNELPTTPSARPEHGVPAPVSDLPVRANHFTFKAGQDEEIKWWKTKNSDWIKRAEEQRRQNIENIKLKNELYMNLDADNILSKGVRKVPFTPAPESDVDMALSFARSDVIAMKAERERRKLAQEGKARSEADGIPLVPEKPSYSSSSSGSGGGRGKDGGERTSKSGDSGWMRRRILQSLFFFSCTGILTSFCQWQLERRNWKSDLVSFRLSQLASEPVGLARAFHRASEQFSRNPVVRGLIDSSRGQGAKPPILRPFLGQENDVSHDDSDMWKKDFADALGHGEIDTSLDREAFEEFLFSLTYLPVFAQGSYDYSREALVGASPPPLDPENVKKRDLQSGYFVVTPFILKEPIEVKLPPQVYKDQQSQQETKSTPLKPRSLKVSTVLVNRGWIPKNLVATYNEFRIFENQYVDKDDAEKALEDPTPATKTVSSEASAVWGGPRKSNESRNENANSTAQVEEAALRKSKENFLSMLKGPESRVSTISGIAHLGVSPPPTKDGEPITTELKIGSHAFQFMDAISIADKLQIKGTMELVYSNGEKADSKWKPPVVVVDCTDTTPPSQKVTNLDVLTPPGSIPPRARLDILRKTEDDHKSFYTTPTTHLIYALTWGSLALVSGGMGIQRLAATAAASSLAGSTKYTAPFMALVADKKESFENDKEDE